MALSPGWLRTELALRRAEPTPYIGRAVVAPARNGQVMRKSGRTLVVGELGICVWPYRTVDGRQFRMPPTAQG